MADYLEAFEKAISNKDENSVIDFTLNHSTEERVKICGEYESKFGRKLLDDFKKKFKSEFLAVLNGLYKDPIEYDADLLYEAMKGIGSDKDIITEVLTFRTPEQLNKIKVKFQEKYGKDLIAEIKDETSGDYRKIVLALLDGNRGTNSSPDLENCSKIADEIYQAGEAKSGTDEEIFIKYFTTLSSAELLLVCKEYHKKYNKNMLDIINNEFNSHTQKLLKIILYALYSPAEFFARQIHDSVAGLGTADSQLIRSIISRAEIDMPKIRKYYKKIFNKEMIDEVNDDLSGSYQKIIEGLMKKLI